jgi:hypothetical protein
LPKKPCFSIGFESQDRLSLKLLSEINMVRETDNPQITGDFANLKRFYAV